MRARLLLPALCLSLARPAAAQIHASMLRQPDVSATSIVFVYAGDVWIVPKTGGNAQRLSSPPGEETFPRFSPDGQSIAFTGDYDGNQDVYVMPVTGGEPERITHHPDPDRLLDWYPDGRQLLFASSMTSEKDRYNKLFRVGKDGGLAVQLPMPYGEFGALSRDGQQIVYTPATRDFRTWKRYRGGLAPKLWLYDLQKNTARKLVDDQANYSQPMWRGDTLYFLSDRGPEQRWNLWAMDMRSSRMRQVTTFKDYDTHFPAIGPQDIVFENGDRLWLMDLATEKLQTVDVTVVTDLASLRPHTGNVASLIVGGDISPTGKRALIEARGDVFSLPAENGVTLDLTHSSGSAERFPAWSPDGKSVAYFSDRTGEYELTLENADGTGEPRTVTKLGPGFRYHIYWSPDSRRVAFIDQAMRIHTVDVASGTDKVIDHANYFYEGNLQAFKASWSADSRWLSYARDLEQPATAIFIYDTQTARSQQVTRGFYGAREPIFDPEGNYLYFLTGRSFNPVYSDVDNTWIYPNSTVVAALPLRTDVDSPLAPRNDEEAAADTAKGKAPADSTKTAAAASPAPKAVNIDFDNMERRTVILPLEPGNYAGLLAVPGKLLVLRQPRTGASDTKNALVYWDLKEREEKTVVADADAFTVSANGQKLLVAKGPKYAILDIKPEQKLDKPLATASLEMTVDPRAEWKQIFNDAWRIERDYFYDPEMHGVDWNAMRQRYGGMLEDARTRDDVNYVIGELLGELNSSHTYKGGGDVDQPKQRSVGLLGADFALENGAYRIRHIVDGAPWDSEVRSPLARPGIKVKEGDYILAVDGTPLDVKQDPYAAFQGMAGKTVSLTVNDRPTLQGSHTVLVTPLASEYRLRNLAWINHNRLRVDSATQGRVGYIFVPSTGIDGQTELVRQYFGQTDKDALIIDERFNNGGQIPDRFVELLNRPRSNYWAVRDGIDWSWPLGVQQGPKVMLINSWSGSGGDMFPFLFKQAGVGPLIGKRTWGGLIGYSGQPSLIDGGGVTAPSFSIYSTDGKWIIEGHGVDPDIEVEDDPAQLAKGIDPQLEAGIREVLKELKEHPPVRPKRPPYPNRAQPVVSDGSGHRN